MFTFIVSKNWKKVFYVLGNHEYYYLNINEIVSKYYNLFNSFGNIILLENESYEINDAVNDDDNEKETENGQKIILYGFTGWIIYDSFVIKWLSSNKRYYGG